MQRSISFLAAAAVLLAGTAGTAGCLGGGDEPEASRNAGATEFALTIADNSIVGGKNTTGAEWLTNWVIPRFVADQKAKGRTVQVRFQPSGAGDEDYKSKVALDLKTGSGADLYSIDGIWLGEFADAGYLKPLDDLVGAGDVDGWDGWRQIPEAVQNNVSYRGERYGIPQGTDGRVIYFNRKLFTQAGLPADWQPASWEEILAAGRAVRARLPGVTPIQLNAGTAMGEATTMQGVLPLLAGTGQQVWADGRWQGNTQAVRDVLGLYQSVYAGGLGDPILQQDAQGRDKSFQAFAAGRIAMLVEGDYFWREVIEPAKGIAKMADRDQNVGYATIPAVRPGAGLRGQDFVSMSGGGSFVLNPATKYPKQAWELLRFMNSTESVTASLGGSPRLTQRQDVNDEVLANDPMLTFVSQRVLPITAYRPGLAVYPQVSQALQQATLDVVSGKSPAEAAAAYQSKLESLVGGADKVASD
jgi:multiple sugar transport system substrate-binding protein